MRKRGETVKGGKRMRGDKMRQIERGEPGGVTGRVIMAGNTGTHILKQ